MPECFVLGAGERRDAEGEAKKNALTRRAKNTASAEGIYHGG